MRHLQEISILLICSLYVLVCHSLLSEQVRKEKIISQINKLTPTHSINKSFENIDIIGFDVCDESQNRLASSKFEFSPGNQFYLIFYCRKNRSKDISPAENKLRTSRAVFAHQNGGYFWSKKTDFLQWKPESKASKEEWKIGGIYRIQFNFKVPEYALPGKYKLKGVNATSVRPEIQRLIAFDRIKINIIRKKTYDSRIIKDYDLSLEECLLNPAFLGNQQIIFFWTGNIEFFIEKNLSNFKKIIVAAKGTSALGICPLLKIYAEKEEIGSVFINSEWNQYEFDLKVNKETHILKVRFDNDGRGAGENRDMYVNMIKLIN